MGFQRARVGAGTLQDHGKSGGRRLLDALVQRREPRSEERHDLEALKGLSLEDCSQPYCGSCSLPYYDGG